MFNVVSKFLEALYAPLHDLVSSSTDGTCSMTGRIQGLATPIEVCTTGNLIRIWCGLHQLDLIMQKVLRKALSEDFYSVLTTLIGHLC